jgi:hypothetical protein
MPTKPLPVTLRAFGNDSAGVSILLMVLRLLTVLDATLIPRATNPTVS